MLLVNKFGGTSVGTVQRIQAVAARLSEEVCAGHQVVAVVSAMSGETNRLLGMAGDITDVPTPRELDVLLSTGEQITIALLTMALHQCGVKAISLTGAQCRILTDDSHSKARIQRIETERLQQHMDDGYVIVAAGFQGVDADGNITTLGRGGSDTTAVALAAALKADECRIYTDVTGVFTTDPRIVPEAKRLDCISYEEMLEMASLGARVLQIRSVEFASKYQVSLRVLSSFEEGPGTWIVSDKNREHHMEQAEIAGIAFSRDEAKLTVTGVPDQPGNAHRILGPVAAANIEIDMIVQNVAADGSTDFTFTVHRDDYDKAMKVLEQLVRNLGAGSVTGDACIAKLSLVGVGMRSHAGIASRMFQILSEKGINLMMISTSEIKISVVIEQDALELGVRALHQGFGLDQKLVTNTG